MNDEPESELAAVVSALPLAGAIALGVALAFIVVHCLVPMVWK
jgi:hypothetical protein